MTVNTTHIDCLAKLPWKGTNKMTDLDKLRQSRDAVYGDPLDNHTFIANAWSMFLQPHADAIGKGEPIPAHVVALMMCQVKMSRMRLMFHQDNYDDCRVYLGFAEQWQKEQMQGTEIDD